MAMNSIDKTFPTKEIKAVHDRRGNMNFRPCVIIVFFSDCRIYLFSSWAASV